MTILDQSGNPFPETAPNITRDRRHARRNYAGSSLDRLTADFLGVNLSADQTLRNSLDRLRGRSRQLVMDNDYAKKFVAMVKSNVIGSNGIRLQARARRDDGSLDTADNSLLEGAFRSWGEKESCTVNRRLTWRDAQKQIIAAVAVDGEVLVKFHPGHGPGGFAIQIIESDFLDVFHNEDLRNGNRIVMGVEIDEFGAPVNYHFTQPSNDNHRNNFRQRIGVIPADEILHIYVQDRPDQNRGLPWMSSSIRRLNNIGKYEEYELVAAREAASKMGFFTSQDGACQLPDNVDTTEIITESSPGHFEFLPEGVDFKAYDPNHPSSVFGDFVKASLRGFASGVNVSYNTVSNDLEGVNFSSIRSGVLEERENWRGVQDWLIGQLHMPVYKKWLMTVIDSPILPLPARRLRKFEEVTWQPRGWEWVDPQKDINAEKTAHELNVTSLSEISSKRGKDLEEVFARIEADKALAEQYGVSLEEAEQEIGVQNDE